MSETPPKVDPPLVDVKVTNPIEYIKIWWNRIIGNEGVDFSLHIKPLTAIAISIAIISVGFGIGRITLPFNIPFLRYTSATPSPTASDSADAWRETGFIGTLQYTSSTNKFFLLTTSSSEAISLQVPTSIALNELIGKRIFVTGNYNKSTRTLVVTDTKNLEVLPKSPVPAPTIEPTSSPEATSSSTPSSLPQ